MLRTTHSPVVERLRGDVSSVGPNDCPKLSVHRHASKVVRIRERLEYAPPLPTRQIHHTSCAVFENQVEPVVGYDLDLGHVDDRGHTPMLRQGRDALQRRIVTSPIPVRLKFALVKLRPLPDETEGPVR